MKTFLFIFLLIVAKVSFSQKNKAPNFEHLLNISTGSSFHGSGDMRGVIINTEYSKNLKKRIGLSFSLGSTLHDGTYPLFFVSPSGENIDGSIRYTTGGLQFASHLGYDLIKTNNHQFQLRVGGLFRYQSSSYFDDLSIFYPAGETGLPVPAIVFNNTTPQRTFAVGASAQLFYNYTINDKFAIGLLAGFQTDSNGDVIRQSCISVGRRF